MCGVVVVRWREIDVDESDEIGNHQGGFTWYFSVVTTTGTLIMCVRGKVFDSGKML